MGIDLGLKDFATLSTGEKIAHPNKHLLKDDQRLKRLQHALSRKQKGSYSWEKARLKLAPTENKIISLGD